MLFRDSSKLHSPSLFLGTAAFFFFAIAKQGDSRYVLTTAQKSATERSKSEMIK